MTKQEFIEQIELRYKEIGDFDFFGDDEYEEILIPLFDVKITFNEDNTFNIYRDFCYPTRDCGENFENDYQTVLQEPLRAFLRAHFCIQPCIMMSADRMPV
jgi:hypothetical protein